VTYRPTDRQTTLLNTVKRRATSVECVATLSAVFEAEEQVRAGCACADVRRRTATEPARLVVVREVVSFLLQRTRHG